MRTYTDEELENIGKESLRALEYQPRVQSARYLAESGELELTMVNGAKILGQARSLKNLTEATDAELADVKPGLFGISVEWDSLDVQYDTTILIEYLTGIKTLRSLASAAGATKTPAKAAAARVNGAKGGRPRKSLQTA